MTELFFKYKKNTYLFDTRRLKLFHLKGNLQIEVDNLETLYMVRLGATEITRKSAYKLATQSSV
jgi:hypothetical protein